LTQSGGKRKGKTKVYSRPNPLIDSPIPPLKMKKKREKKNMKEERRKRSVKGLYKWPTAIK